MGISLRITLIVVSALTATFVFRKIRKSQFSISDTLYWIFFCILLLILSIFPGITYYFSNLIGFEAPSNFIIVVFIFLILIKMFLMAVKISKLESTIVKFAQTYAINKSSDNNNEVIK